MQSRLTVDMGFLPRVEAVVSLSLSAVTASTWLVWRKPTWGT